MLRRGLVSLLICLTCLSIFVITGSVAHTNAKSKLEKLSISNTAGPELISYNGKNLYVALGVQQSKTSKDGVNWTTHNIDLEETSGSSIILLDIAYGNECFVAVGRGQTYMFTSKDGVKWKPVRLSTEKEILNRIDYEVSHIVWNGKEFLAIGTTQSEETYVAWKSKDGVTWSRYLITGIENRSEINELRSFGGEYYSVGGSSYNYGVILKSTDGISWDQVKYVSKSVLYDISCNNKYYVAVGDNGVSLNSIDLKNWTEHKNVIVNEHVDQHKLVTRDNYFYYYTMKYNIYGYLNGLNVFKSDDGLAWKDLGVITYQDEDMEQAIYQFKSFDSFGDTIYATTLNHDIVSSKDGIEWTLDSKAVGEGYYHIKNLSYAGNKYFATSDIEDFLHISNSPVNTVPQTKTLYLSEDGINWTDYSDSAPGFMGKVYYDGTYYTSFGYESMSNSHYFKVFRSKDGYEWSSYDYQFLDNPLEINTFIYQNQFFSDVTYVNNTYVMFAIKNENNNRYGLIYTSKDGTSWSLAYSKKNIEFYEITYGKGTYVISATNFSSIIMITTKDFVKFQNAYTTDTYSHVQGLYFDGKQFGFVGDAYYKYLVTSTDCKKWKDAVIKPGDNFLHELTRHCLLHEGGYYFYLENVMTQTNIDMSFVNMSVDGKTWSELNVLRRCNIESIIWDGKKFILAGENCFYTYTP